MEAISIGQHKTCGIKHAEGMTARADVSGECFRCFVFGLDDHLNITRHLHPFALRAGIFTITITEAARAAALTRRAIATWARRTITTRTTALTWRAIATRTATLAGRTVTTRRALSLTVAGWTWTVAEATTTAWAACWRTITAITAEAATARAAIFAFLIAAQVSSAASAHAGHPGRHHFQFGKIHRSRRRDGCGWCIGCRFRLSHDGDNGRALWDAFL
jgi:hypothetical protein